MNLKQIQSDPRAFRNALRIDCDGPARRLGDCMDPWQRKDFEALDPGWKRVVSNDTSFNIENILLRGYLERGRGSSKTTDLAVMVCWALFASKRKLQGYGAAADKDQAALLKNAIEKVCLLNPWLRQILKVDKSKVVNVRTGSTLEIISSDAPTSYGILPDFIICDELVHWTNRDLWDSLISSAAKRANCMMVIISNAGYGESWQWETREIIRQDPSWYFSRLNGPVASWIDEYRLAEQKRLLPSIAYRRLWLNEWTSGSGDALNPNDIENAIKLKGPSHIYHAGWVYYAGLDLGLSRDKAALAIIAQNIGWTEELPREVRVLSTTQRSMIDLGLVEEPPEEEMETVFHEGTGKIRLVQLHVWAPTKNHKVDIERIEKQILLLNEAFHFQVAVDPWQASYLCQRLKKNNVAVEEIYFTSETMKSLCSCTLEAFNEGNLEIYPDPQLLSDLRALRIEEKSYGCRLTSPRGVSGHGDAATALELAFHTCDKNSNLPFATKPQGDILCY